MSGGRTQFAILSFLRLGEMSGAEVRSYCQSRFGQFWNESYGQIYPTLAAMAKAGLIAKTETGSGKSVRYKITAKGLKAHRQWVNETPAPRIVRDELILKMFSAGAGDPEIMLEHIAGAAQRARAQLDEIKSASVELTRMASAAPDFPYWSLMLRAGELFGEARLQWCEEAAAVVTAQKEKLEAAS